MRRTRISRGALALALSAVACGGPGDPAHPVRVTIPKGATLRAAAESLAAHHVVSSPTMFTLYARITGKGRAIQAGIYDVPGGASLGRVLSLVVSGETALQPVTVREGLTMIEVANEVQQQIGLPGVELLTVTRDSALRAELNVPTPTLEGYLYPSTYFVRLDATAPALVRQIVDEFLARWRPEWTHRAEAMGLTRHQIVTLASIIEGEVRYGPDRRFVSSVYHNRMRRGMRLQADPTVIYALGRRRRLWEKDYQTRSPYNTYLIQGLPPGPIGQPSEESIEAALFPEATPFLYFVARADGKHIFSRTLLEHLAAIREIRNNR